MRPWERTDTPGVAVAPVVALVRALFASLVLSFVLGGCSGDVDEDGLLTDPAAAADEVVTAVAGGRAAFGGGWRGSWDRSTSPCEGGGDQFRGYFEQQPSGDQDESERVMRDVWARHASGSEIVRTDRPDGSTEVLLRRPDGFVTLMTVTDSKTSFIATSACFDEAVEADPERLLPQSEPGVTVF